MRSTHSLHLYDFEGHGLSPTSPLSEITIESLNDNLHGIFQQAKIATGAALFAHSMGCPVAVRFALKHPALVSKLVLLGPPPSLLPEAGSKGSHDRAALVRSKGMAAVVDAVAAEGTSEKTKKNNLVALTAVRLSLLGQDPEGYAKACAALAKSADLMLDFDKVEAETLIITGARDKISPPELCKKFGGELQNCKGVHVLEDVGHWHVFEDAVGVAKAVGGFL